jgi:hypothetical protein
MPKVYIAAHHMSLDRGLTYLPEHSSNLTSAICLEHFHQALYAITFGVRFHLKRGGFAMQDAIHKTAFVQAAFDAVMHHVMGNNALLWAGDTFDSKTIPHDFHLIVFAGAFGKN